MKNGWKIPSPRTDRHATDITCTEQNNEITFYIVVTIAVTEYLIQII